MSNPKGKIEASVESNLLYERLIQTKPGEIIKYAELSHLIGMNVTSQQGRGYLRTARNMTQSNREILIRTIRGEGVQHATGVDVVDDIGKDRKGIRRRVMKAARKPACIKNYDSLPDDVKIRHNVELSLIGAIKQATAPATRKRIASVAKEGGRALPIGKTLELFIID